MMFEPIERQAVTPPLSSTLSAEPTGDPLGEILMLSDLVKQMAHDTRRSVEAILPAATHWSDFDQLDVLMSAIQRVAREARQELATAG